MKKLFITFLLTLLVPFFTACEVSNTDLANSLEGNMTRLVYSIGYLDSISTEELTGLVNNSSYFTHSSLYTAAADTTEAVDESLDATTNVSKGDSITDNALTTPNTLDDGLNNSTTISGRSNFRNASYRSNTYTNPITNQSNNSLTNDITTTNSVAGAYNTGTVDMSLLETNASDLNDILLDISNKRGIIMLYCTDLRSGRATLSSQDKEAIAEYDDIIKETTNYLNNNTGVLTNYFNSISSISGQENSAELINAKLIRANEVLKTRYAKLDTCLDSLNAIINIMINSIGYDYSSLYNMQNNQFNNTTINNTTATDVNTSTDSASNILEQTVDQSHNSTDINTSLENSTTNQSTTYPITNPSIVTDNNATTNGINNNCCPNVINPLSTTNSCCPNINSTTANNSNCCLNNTKLLNNNTSNYSTTTSYTPPTTKQNYLSNYTNPNTDGDTIVNYNYDGNNSSNIINDNNSQANTPATLELNDADYAQIETSEIDKLNETEVALNGGLRKNLNTEKIPAENIDSVVASALIYNPETNKNPQETDSNAAKELRFTRPAQHAENKDIVKRPERSRSNPLTNENLIKDFSDSEFTESEKELTPELLPFTSTNPNPSPNTLELKPVKPTPELGKIIFLPFKYEEDDVLKKIPRK